MASKTFNSYLLKKPKSSHYYFRIRVPLSLQRVVSRNEFRYSLRTSDEIEASYLAIRIAHRLKLLFRHLNGGSMRELTNEELELLVYREMRKELAFNEENRRDWLGQSHDEDAFETYIGLLKENISGFNDELRTGNYSTYRETAEELMKDRDIDGFKRGDYSFDRLCRELLKARVRVLEVELKRAQGDFSDDIETEISRKLDTSGAQQDSIKKVDAATPDQNEDISPKISQAIHLFSEERKRAGVWTPKTEQEYLSSLGLLVEALGDIPISALDAVAAREFKAIIMALPPNMRKNPLFRGKSIKEIVAAKVKNPMSPLTINKILDRASTMMNWAVKNGYADKNQLLGMQIPSKKRPDEFRDPFSTEDLRHLFQSTAYIEDDHRHSYYFWIPIIALFTGMRLDEICQLHLKDIRFVDEVYVFDVNDDGEKKLKNLSSKRVVPIHDFLLNDLMIVKYAEMLKQRGESRLFPELRRGRDGYSHDVSKWFARYRTRYGIKPGRGKKDFHSFRHTLADNLKQATVEPTLLSELLGHEVGSITLGRYGKRYNAKLLKEKIVDQLKFDVDLSHLKRSKFVGRQ